MAKVLKAKLVASKVYDSAESIKLQFKLTNSSKDDVYVLKWNTPLEGLNSDCLKVVRDGAKSVAYDGPMIKRGTPGPDAYVLIRAGETLTADVNVSDSYAVSKPGDYSVELNIDALEHLPVSSVGVEASPAGVASAFSKQGTVPSVVSLTGGQAGFKVQKGAAQVATRGQAARKAEKALAKAATASGASSVLAAAQAAGPLPPSIVGGTATQKNQAKKAHADGFKLCEAALAGVANNARYKEWFGTHTTARANKVKAVYTKVRDRMKTTTLTYDLTKTGCRDGVYAYTYKNSSTIWMCDAFWTAPATGTDSKAGTVLHEHTHADAGTDDVKYGQTNCRALAISNPDDAVRNADTYEYYAGG